MATPETLEHPAVEVAPAQAPDSAPTSPQTETRPPRLSEALRYGQMNVGQSYGSFLDENDRMCALGTIWHSMGYAVGSDTGIGSFVERNPEWGFLLEFMNTEPLRNGVCGIGVPPCTQARPIENLAEVVIHWNDDHHMPRNDIADRLSRFGL